MKQSQLKKKTQKTSVSLKNLFEKAYTRDLKLSMYRHNPQQWFLYKLSMNLLITVGK